jgi:hypothetical protein
MWCDTDQSVITVIIGFMGFWDIRNLDVPVWELCESFWVFLIVECRETIFRLVELDVEFKFWNLQLNIEMKISQSRYLANSPPKAKTYWPTSSTPFIFHKFSFPKTNKFDCRLKYLNLGRFAILILPKVITRFPNYKKFINI